MSKSENQLSTAPGTFHRASIYFTESQSVEAACEEHPMIQ